VVFDIEAVRASFPALTSGNIFFDNPGGTQVPTKVIQTMGDYLVRTNANHGGAFKTSRESDEILTNARSAMADFLNAENPAEIIFGPNMTTLTFRMSEILAAELAEGDEIIVTRLDHDANISPWIQLAAQKGCTVKWLDFDVEDCTLSLEALDKLLSKRTKLIALGYASNAVGTINPAASIIQRAQEAEALTYVDAVHFAPHGPIDVQALECDFLAVSVYKFFGPHVGVLYGKQEHLQRLTPKKVRPAPANAPDKFEQGTGNFEGIAGSLAAIEYLEELGTQYPAEPDGGLEAMYSGRKRRLKRAMNAIRAYEIELSLELLQALESVPTIQVYGITDRKRLDRRVPTYSFTMHGYSPRQVAEKLDQAGIFVWDGNYYALAVTERLGLEGKGGMVRVGLAHYNTSQEISRLGEALQAMEEKSSR
jgi:cysteine desulfurase family protein (TIGR01976 family)